MPEREEPSRGGGHSAHPPRWAPALGGLPLFLPHQTFFPAMHVGGFIPGFASCQELGVRACSVTQLYLTLCDPQAPLFMGFLRQEDWSGLPFSPPGDLPDAGIEPESPLLDSLSLSPQGRPIQNLSQNITICVESFSRHTSFPSFLPSSFLSSLLPCLPLFSFPFLFWAQF